MADRHAQIRMLLATRFDGLPEPVRRDLTVAGFVHNADAHVTCPDCFGEQPGRNGCDTCRGAGFLVERRLRDPYAVSTVTPYGMSGDRHERRRELDATIARLEAQTRAPWPSEQDAIADANQHPYGWETARRRMYAMFDYRALDVAVELLHGAFPGMSPASTRGLTFVDPRMPDPIRAPVEAVVLNALAQGRWADPRARAQRDRQARREVQAGRPYSEVAAELGLSQRQLRRILAGETEAA